VTSYIGVCSILVGSVPVPILVLFPAPLSYSANDDLCAGPPALSSRSQSCLFTATVDLFKQVTHHSDQRRS